MNKVVMRASSLTFNSIFAKPRVQQMSWRTELQNWVASTKCKSFADLGHGTEPLIEHWTLPSCQQIGIDIIRPLRDEMKRKFPQAEWKYKDILAEPEPLPGEIWFARNVGATWTIQEWNQLFEQFLRGNAQYLILNNHPRDDAENKAGTPIDLCKKPFELPPPIKTIRDAPIGTTRQNLSIWTRMQMLEWQAKRTLPIKKPLRDPPLSTSHGTQDTPSSQRNTIPLRLRSLRDHTG